MKSLLLKFILFVSLIIIVDRVIYYLLQINRPIDYKYFLDQKKLFFSEENSGTAKEPRIIKAIVFFLNSPVAEQQKKSSSGRRTCTRRFCCRLKSFLVFIAVVRCYPAFSLLTGRGNGIPS